MPSASPAKPRLIVICIALVASAAPALIIEAGAADEALDSHLGDAEGARQPVAMKLIAGAVPVPCFATVITGSCRRLCRVDEHRLASIAKSKPPALLPPLNNNVAPLPGFNRRRYRRASGARRRSGDCRDQVACRILGARARRHLTDAAAERVSGRHTIAGDGQGIAGGRRFRELELADALIKPRQPSRRRDRAGVFQAVPSGPRRRCRSC